MGNKKLDESGKFIGGDTVANSEPLKVGQVVKSCVRNQKGRMGSFMHRINVEKIDEHGVYGTWFYGKHMHGVQFIEGEWRETGNTDFVYMDQVKEALESGSIKREEQDNGGAV